jgi:hypothetical protein
MKVMLAIYGEFSHNGSDLGRLTLGRSRIVAAVCKAFVALNIQWTMPAIQPAQVPPASPGTPLQLAIQT